MQAATAYPVARYMDFFDYVPASEIPGVLNHSSILLQLANTFASNGPKGFMTTKLFESMAVEPLLCVKSDESYLEETIRITRSAGSPDDRRSLSFYLAPLSVLAG